MTSGFLAFAFRYAGRSIMRNKRRAVLTISTVGLSVGVTTFSVRYSEALLSIWENSSIDRGNGHAQIHAPKYYDHPDVLSEEIAMKEGQAVEGDLRADPGVDVVSRRLNFEGVISSGSKTVYFLGKGVVPETERKACPALFKDDGDQGEFVNAGIENGIVIGKGLADTLELKVGDEASLLIHTMSGAVNGVDVKVVGIMNMPIPAMSKRLLMMNIGYAQKFIDLPGKYTELVIRLKPGVDPDQWVPAFAPKVAGHQLDLRGWWVIDPFVRKLKKIWDSIVGVISSLLFISAAIAVLNIVFMMVAERTIEIGTLMAIGAKPRDVRTMFTLEAALIGLLGGAFGSIVSNILLQIMNVMGVRFQSPFGTGIITAHPSVSLVVSLAISGIAILICYVSALAPARKASHVEPVVAFRGQIT